jgi:hypothetical protein
MIALDPKNFPDAGSELNVSRPERNSCSRKGALSTSPFESA